MTDYVFEPLDTDPEELFQGFVEYVQQYFPAWDYEEGQLDVIIARYFSLQAAFTADMATRVQRAIFRYFGASLAGIPPLPGNQAIATVHFNINDPNVPPVTRTLTFGTNVGLTDVNGDVQMFTLMDDLVAPPGTISMDAYVQATETGAIGNDITGTVDLVEQVDWITDAYVVGYSSGGADPEDDEVYIQRLTENLALMAPRPILAEDYSIFAQNIAGVWRAAVVDNLGGGTNQINRITTDADGGTFTLSWRGAGPSTPIPYNATNADVKAAFTSLSNVESFDVNVTRGPLPEIPIEIEFIGRYGFQDQSIIDFDVDLLSFSTFSIIQTQPGVVSTTGNENTISISAVDESGNAINDTVKANMMNYLDGTRPQNFIITYVDPAYHIIDINYSARCLKGYDPDSVRTSVDTALRTYLDPANWGRAPSASNNRTWILKPNVRYLELTTIVENTPGVDYVESLAFNLDGGAFNSSDKTFTGSFSLTMPGAIFGTINLPV